MGVICLEVRATVTNVASMNVAVPQAASGLSLEKGFPARIPCPRPVHTLNLICHWMSSLAIKDMASDQCAKGPLSGSSHRNDKLWLETAKLSNSGVDKTGRVKAGLKVATSLLRLLCR